MWTLTSSRAKPLRRSQVSSAWAEEADPNAPPAIEEALLLWLESLNRPACIRPGEPLELAHRRAGRVELVEELRRHYENQHGRGD